jgi:hypothetical protein
MRNPLKMPANKPANKSISSHRSIFVIGIIASMGSAAFACGGVESDLFSDNGVGGDTVTDASTDARNTKGDSGKSDASTTGDGGIITPVDGGGPRPGIVPALCGTSTTCNSSNPTCCATQSDGLGTPASYGCTPSASSCTSSSKVPVGCRDNTDCGGGAPNCCGELVDPSAQGGYRNVICESTCVAEDDAGNVTAHVPFCTVGQLPDVCARWGLTCQPSTLLAGFSVCGND